LLNQSVTQKLADFCEFSGRREALDMAQCPGLIWSGTTICLKLYARVSDMA